MPLPHPEPGLVISYAYLWRHQCDKGQTEGRKIRPSVIVLAVENKAGETIVTVAPITHTAPSQPLLAVEIPQKVKQHLGLDEDRSWVMVEEVNQFVWPGYDLRPVPGSKTRFDFGFLPPRLFEAVKTGVLNVFLDRRGNMTKRD
jgi:mRNA-degrading endonuclease toxin of MazEF toxin-antitoxin module